MELDLVNRGSRVVWWSILVVRRVILDGRFVHIVSDFLNKDEVSQTQSWTPTSMPTRGCGCGRGNGRSVGK
ncbi:hypothetical protein PVK06_001829 [Gossypium arboreum]|uniref:Uncharacterized protein n=1 Tax=Gossypium arboreum TaxID=29729 RepID=A0ABR0R3E1_GOSAR|nr:hypothetical protein PVK06_001829 [Gossypium arboreum]